MATPKDKKYSCMDCGAKLPNIDQHGVTLYCPTCGNYQLRAGHAQGDDTDKPMKHIPPLPKLKPKQPPCHYCGSTNPEGAERVELKVDHSGYEEWFPLCAECIERTECGGDQRYDTTDPEPDNVPAPEQGELPWELPWRAEVLRNTTTAPSRTSPVDPTPDLQVGITHIDLAECVYNALANTDGLRKREAVAYKLALYTVTNELAKCLALHDTGEAGPGWVDEFYNVARGWEKDQ